MAHGRILITGGSGLVGTLLRPRLARPGRILRLLDVRPPEPLDGAGAEEQVTASIEDLEALAAACRDVDAVIHLGGVASEGDLDTIVRVNIAGTRNVLEAARVAGVSRVVLASSNHAVGFTPRSEAPPGGLPADVPPRPDTLYGWSKVAMEAAGRLYVDRYGMDVICLRIGTWEQRPPDTRALATWLSPDDGALLAEACLAAESPGFRLVWGVSRNTRRWWSLAEGGAIGYHPKDDAEVYAKEILAARPPGTHNAPADPDFHTDPILNRTGGPFCDTPLGQPL